MVRVLGISEEAARAKTDFSKGKVRPTKVKALTDQLGHKRANAYLKNFGPEWICNNGMVFFGPHKQRRRTPRRVYRK